MGLEASQRDLQMQTRTQSKLHLGKVASNQLGVLRRAVRAALQGRLPPQQVSRLLDEIDFSTIIHLSDLRDSQQNIPSGLKQNVQ